MTNLHNDSKNNFVNFIRRNQPLPPQAAPDLEQRIMDSLEPHTASERKRLKTGWTIPSAIATGFLFTTVSFGIRTPRLAIEPKDLENFLISSWQDTLDTDNHEALEGNAAQWLLPVVSEPPQALSVSAQ